MDAQFKVGDKVKIKTISKGISEIGEVIALHFIPLGSGAYYAYEVRWPMTVGILGALYYDRDLELADTCTCNNSGICYDCTLNRVKNTQLHATPMPILSHPHFGINWTFGDSFSIDFEEPSECECGTKNAIGQGHSKWCKCYRKEF